METFPAIPGPSKADPDTTVRVNEASLGDGYTQTTGDGLNAIFDTYSVFWGLLTKSELDVFLAFLEARGGYQAFLWTPPMDAAARQWKCKTWRRQNLGGGWFSLSATFKESFDL